MATVISYSEAVQTLKDWMAALSAAQSGQSYSIGGRTLTRQDITEIRSEIQRWHNTVAALEAQQKGQPRNLGAKASFDAPGGSGGIIPGDIWTDWRT